MPATAIKQGSVHSQDDRGFLIRQAYLIRDATSEKIARAAEGFPVYGASQVVDGQTVYVQRRDVEPIEDSPTHWVGNVEYRPEDVGQLDPSVVDRPGVGSQVQVVKVWRLGTAARLLKPPDSFSNPDQDPITGDIEGTHVDISGGDPIDHVLVQIRRSITFEIASPAPEYRYVASVLKRNRQVYGPYPEGSVLFTDFEIRPVSANRDSVTLNFVFDQWAHLRQKTFYSAEGVVTKTPFVGPPSPGGEYVIPVGHALHVVWYQPFPATVPFSPLFANYVNPWGFTQ